ncbi:fasciclin domain-containing protein [Maribellus maritimus]|uniref:fasciclin domain-containing protein n=1 Tax=Maribellus maritimus TaxID=2870838 RepID=UPI001EEC7C9C|nr:fasciclin domain-containing protein [Maribellus maritimus]MCG6188751.1 fasciclin domain-containing protein [Maribellus maritimus]
MKTTKNMKTMKLGSGFLPLIVSMGLLIFTACENDNDEPVPQPDEKNIVEVAQEAGQFETLIEAAQKAGLADFLSTESNLTVFAPSDDAFSALLSELGLSSLDDIDAASLANILRYHVVAGQVYSADLSTGAVPSLNTESPDGEAVSLWLNTGDNVTINNAVVTAVDVQASNGVIHLIDKVMLPPTVVDIATYANDFSSLVAAVVKADLVETLNSVGPFTVFAPTNAAFSDLFSALGISGLDEVPVETLSSILTYHVVGDNVLSTELSNGMVTTVSGESFDVSLGSEVLLNGEAKVIVTDIQGTNGIVHVIDQVLLPE